MNRILRKRFSTAPIACSVLILVLAGCGLDGSDSVSESDSQVVLPSKPSTGMDGQRRLQMTEASKCSAGMKSPWAAEYAGKIERIGKLYLSLEREFGPPDTCSGGAERVYEGRTYGNLQFNWDKGLRFVVETQPISTIKRTLVAPNGFANPQAIRELVRDYADLSKYKIDWAKPEIVRSDSSVIEEFVGEIPGDNAIVRFVMQGEKLIQASASRAP